MPHRENAHHNMAQPDPISSSDEPETAAVEPSPSERPKEGEGETVSSVEGPGAVLSDSVHAALKAMHRAPEQNMMGRVDEEF